MALLAVEGFSGSTSIADLVSGGVLVTNTRPTAFIMPGGAFGDNYLRLIPDPSTTNGGPTITNVFWVHAPNSVTFYCGFRLAMNDQVSADPRSEQIRLIDTAGNEQFRLQISHQTGTIVAFRDRDNYLGSTPVGALMNNLAFQYVEVGGIINANNGTVTIKVNGNVVMNVSGINNKNSQNTNGVAGLQFVNDPFYRGYGDLTPPTELRIQHLYFCDDSTGSNNTFLGDTRVVGVHAAASGSSTQFTPVGGGTNLANANTFPPTPATNYNQDTVAGHSDLFTLAAFPAGITKVTALAVKSLLSKPNAGLRTISNQVLSGASLGASTPVSVGTAPTYVAGIFVLDPATGAPWTTPAAQGAQFGYGIVT